MLDIAAALVPSVGVGLLFWFVVRAILSADRRERAAVAQFEREENDRPNTESGEN